LVKNRFLGFVRCLVADCKHPNEISENVVVGVSFGPTQDVGFLVGKVVASVVSLLRQVFKIVLRIV
jgi:hypothetical protein